MTPTQPEKRKPLTWAEVPEAEKKRLAKNEAAQRRETKKRGLPALPVSVEGLWLVQRGMCTCNECRGEVPLAGAVQQARSRAGNLRHVEGPQVRGGSDALETKGKKQMVWKPPPPRHKGQRIETWI